MAGHRYVVTGDPEVARDTIYSALQADGFTVTWKSDWSAIAERRVKGDSLMLALVSGKEGRHLTLDIIARSIGEDWIFTLTHGTSGLLTKNQDISSFGDIHLKVATALHRAGLLIDGSSFE